MHHFKSNKEVVAAGHQFARNIGAETPLIEMAKMVTELSSRLDVATVRANLMAAEVLRINSVLPDTITALQAAGADMTLIDDLNAALATPACDQWIRTLRIRHKDKLAAELNVMAAENAMLKGGIGFFSYGTDSGFEEHDSAEKAIAAADSDIDYYRGDACDGWSEETEQTVWGVILQRATMIDERPRTEEDSYLGSHIASICDYALLPNMATPATDAYLNTVRAEGIHFAANRILAAWKSCLIKATPAEASDVSGAVLSALEFLPKANPEEFKRDYADQVRADIAELLRAGKDGE